MIVPPVMYRLECAELLTFLCAALLDDLYLSLECDALCAPNNPNPWTENSQWCDYCPSMRTENNIHAEIGQQCYDTFLSIFTSNK